MMIRNLCCALFALVLCASSQGATDAQFYGSEDFYRVEKIDMHVHLHSAGPKFMREARHDHFRLLSINVDYSDFPPLDQQQRIAETLLKKYPATFAFAATFSVQNYDQPGWAEAVNRHIDEAVRHGAVAVKVWKNIGMELRSKDGKMVMIDDPHFRPVFDHLAQIHIPLLGHQGEPKNCWLPVAEMSVKNDVEYFTTHPQYHMYLHPELPSYEDQIRARDNMLLQHPDLQFVGLHLASLEWSVTELAGFLDRFPTAMVDMAARIGQLQSQSIQNRELVRNFLIKYQDRIMYSTDSEQDPDTPPSSATASKLPGQSESGAELPFEVQTRQVWLRDWQYFTSAGLLSVPELDQPVQGLKLPRNVIDKIYRLNAERLFPKAWHAVH